MLTVKDIVHNYPPADEKKAFNKITQSSLIANVDKWGKKLMFLVLKYSPGFKKSLKIKS